MTTYSAIANSEIAVGAPVTNSLMTKNRDNPLAIQENDASAPTNAYATTAGTASTITSQGALATLNSVTATEIDADSVGQSEVKTTYQEVTQAVNSGVTTEKPFVATGGVYCLGHTLRGSLAGNAGQIIRLDRYYLTTFITSYVAQWMLTVGDPDTNGAFTGYARLYYINSSPPYDLGFGNIPLFIFAVIDNATGDVDSVSLSVDAPWHYNGPTNITPSSYGKDGTPYKTLPEIEFELIAQGKTLAQELRGISRAATLARLKNDPVITVEIDQAMKNADMASIPHPFRNTLPGKTIVVVNPQSDICEDLLLMHERGESVAELFHNGDIILESSTLQRGFDPSVKCVDISWS